VYTQPERGEHSRVPVAHESLIYPQPRHDLSGGDTPNILWSLSLLLGILALLGMGPADAPPFDTLTTYTCDPLPALRTSWNRTPIWPMYSICRAGKATVYQRGLPPTTMNFSQWQTCRRAVGVVRIWRHANPSPYGNFVFQMSCNDDIYLDYKSRAASYTAIHAMAVLVAWGLVILSLTFLTSRLYRRQRRHRTTPNIATNKARS
jgi:hypothetical protein